MAAPPPYSSLQTMLRAAVQSVHWTYSLFWQLSPQQGILRWGDGYYNGAIKTRKTVQAMEVSSEEASLQRSEQLRELYESLSSGGADNTNVQSRRPSASLSPEDLTESEWFYLLCVSFSFHSGVGLPGKAYARRQHLWLTGANEVDTETFSRAILAKSAHIQTVVCIPLLEGVVELGTTDKVEEDLNFIRHIKSFFIEECRPILKPAISEHSTSSNIPTTSSYPAIAAPNNIPNQKHIIKVNNVVDKVEGKLNSEAETVRNSLLVRELMELDTLVEFRVGSPQDGSNHLDSFPTEESMALCSVGLEHLQLQLPPSSAHAHAAPSENLAQGDTDTHYSQTVSSILQNTAGSTSHLTESYHSAFNKWNSGADDYCHHFPVRVADVTSQWVLKYILFSVPCLHANRLKEQAAAPFDTGHVMAERRRREKLNEKFLILRSMVPVVTRMDKVSILGDTIEYIKQLREKIESLEACEHLAGKRRMREVEVSIIESDDVLLEVECVHREGLLMDLMTLLRALGVEVIMVQSWVKDDGVFVAEMRAKVKENDKGNKVSILEVKKALNQIILHHEPEPLYILASNDPYTLASSDHF